MEESICRYNLVGFPPCPQKAITVAEGYRIMTDKPIKTVGDLKKRLQNFKDDEPIYFHDSYWGTNTEPFVHYTDSFDLNEKDEWVKENKLIIASHECDKVDDR